MRAGHRPEEVLVTARNAVLPPGHCDDVRLDMPAGRPTVSVRFTIVGSHTTDEDQRAYRYGLGIVEQVNRIAVTFAPRVFRRRGGRWSPVLA